nr:hypothetical protein [Gammaproteobacteria bacterium]
MYRRRRFDLRRRRRMNAALTRRELVCGGKSRFRERGSGCAGGRVAGGDVPRGKTLCKKKKAAASRRETAAQHE